MANTCITRLLVIFMIACTMVFSMPVVSCVQGPSFIPLWMAPEKNQEELVGKVVIRLAISAPRRESGISCGATGGVSIHIVPEPLETNEYMHYVLAELIDGETKGLFDAIAGTVLFPMYRTQYDHDYVVRLPIINAADPVYGGIDVTLRLTVVSVDGRYSNPSEDFRVFRPSGSEGNVTRYIGKIENDYTLSKAAETARAVEKLILNNQSKGTNAPFEGIYLDADTELLNRNRQAVQEIESLFDEFFDVMEKQDESGYFDYGEFLELYPEFSAFKSHSNEYTQQLVNMESHNGIAIQYLPGRMKILVPRSAKGKDFRASLRDTVQQIVQMY